VAQVCDDTCARLRKERERPLGMNITLVPARSVVIQVADMGHTLQGRNQGDVFAQSGYCTAARSFLIAFQLVFCFPRVNIQFKRHTQTPMLLFICKITNNLQEVKFSIGMEYNIYKSYSIYIYIKMNFIVYK
jgi:hypothetical protein